MRRYIITLCKPTGLLACFLLLLGALPADRHAADPPRVVVSILPLHSLAAGVMQGIATPQLLVRGVASPHTYSMRPSDARALQEAQAVFWVGPDIETFLAKPLAGLSAATQVVQVSKAEGLALREVREGGAWAAHDHGHNAGHPHEADEPRSLHSRRASHGHGHSHGRSHEHELDMHIWLSTDNARAVVRAIAATLADIDSSRAAQYGANAERVLARLDALDVKLRQQLAPVRDRPFIVFHDAYQYFEKAHGLRGVGSITLNPDQPPGARRIQELRARVQELGAVCVFSEPQFEPRLVQTVVDGTNARRGVLDPLGAAIPPGPAHYFLLMEGLAASLVDCLGQS